MFTEVFQHQGKFLFEPTS